MCCKLPCQPEGIAGLNVPPFKLHNRVCHTLSNSRYGASAVPLEVLGEHQAVVHVLPRSAIEALTVPVRDFQLSLTFLPSALRSLAGQGRTHST